MKTKFPMIGPAKMAKRNIVVCGGCGFIGSNFAHTIHQAKPEVDITILDAFTYAGSVDNLGDLQNDQRVNIQTVDITDTEQIKVLENQQIDLVINFAAETHVDRSLYYSNDFIRTNVLGMGNLLNICRQLNIPFLQISTDEVYGPALDNNDYSEKAPLNPTSPYAASKAAADLMVLAAIKTHQQSAAIVRTCNNYGPRQFPEKLIPYFTYLCNEDKDLPIYGDGQQQRNWIYVEDFCNALLPILDSFPEGQILNIGSDIELKNIDLVKQLLNITNSKSKIKYVDDRPAHDKCYRISSTEYENIYGTIPRRDFQIGLQQTIAWYQANSSIFKRLKDVNASEFISKHYRSHS